MQPLTAVVLGATGFTGQLLVQQLLSDAAFSKVRILVRRPVEFSHSKLEVEVVNFDDLTDYQSKLGKGDCIFCCIGTTKKKVKGDQNAYRKIDFDIPVNAAKMGKASAFTRYLLVSAVGANAASSNFYLKLKGEVEKNIDTINYNSLHIFKPSILLGHRKEFRLGELAGKAIMKVFSLLMFGNLNKYKGIEVADVVKAMVSEAKFGKKGTFVHHYEDMIKAKNL